MIVCENLVKIYKADEIEVLALQGLDLRVEAGEFMGIIGNSGSGKSTFLNILGGLDTPSAGRLVVDGQNLLKMTPAQMNAYKRCTVGFMWQNSARNFIPYLTALENILLPMRLDHRVDRAYAQQLLDMVGLPAKANSKLSQLSGGEQQRIAIAIALSNRPHLLLADEPTGALDTKATARVLETLRHINRTLNITMVIVTHDRQVTRYVDRVVSIRDGRTSSEFLRREDVSATPHTTADTHIEYAILDKYGRLQLPAECIEALQLADTTRLAVQYEGRTITLTVPDTLSGKKG